MGRPLVCGVPDKLRQLEEMMEEHGVEVDHATLNRWVLKYVPLLEREFRARKHPVGPSWRMDETYVRVKGSWKYLYRAVDKARDTVDFLLTAKRDRKAALRFLRKAIKWNGTPMKVTIDKSGANTAALESHNAETEAGVEIPQIKYLNNIVEQDHRAIKRLTRPTLEFKSFRSAAVTLAGIELMHMIRKGQLLPTGEVRPAQQFYLLAGKTQLYPRLSHVRPKTCDRPRKRATNHTARKPGNAAALRARLDGFHDLVRRCPANRVTGQRRDRRSVPRRGWAPPQPRHPGPAGERDRRPAPPARFGRADARSAGESGPARRPPQRDLPPQATTGAGPASASRGRLWRRPGRAAGSRPAAAGRQWPRPRGAGWPRCRTHPVHRERGRVDH